MRVKEKQRSVCAFVLFSQGQEMSKCNEVIPMHVECTRLPPPDTPRHPRHATVMVKVVVTSSSRISAPIWQDDIAAHQAAEKEPSSLALRYRCHCCCRLHWLPDIYRLAQKSHTTDFFLHEYPSSRQNHRCLSYDTNFIAH